MTRLNVHFFEVTTPIWTKSMGQRLREVRKMEGISQGKLARRLGVSQSHLSKLEKGKTGSADFTMMKFLHSLGVNTEYVLLGGIGPILLTVGRN